MGKDIDLNSFWIYKADIMDVLDWIRLIGNINKTDGERQKRNLKSN